MSGWVPMPSEVWASVVEHLPKPWTEDQARFDLRWWVDHNGVGKVPGPPPSRRVLAARWGWSPDEVRTELRNPQRWWDPEKGPAPTSRNVLTQRRPGVTHDDPPTPHGEQSNVDNDEGLTHGDPQVPSSDPPSPQRVDPQPPPHPQPPAGQETFSWDEAPTVPDNQPPDRFDEAAAFFGHVVNVACGRKQSHGPSRKSKTGKKLLVELKRNAEDVFDAFRYVAEGQTSHADFLRQQHRPDMDSVLAHVERYAERWRAGPEAPARDPPHRGRPEPDRSWLRVGRTTAPYDPNDMTGFFEDEAP